MLWILICPLYSLSACELLKSSKLLKDGLFPVNHHDIIHFKFQLQFHPVGREVGGGIGMGKTCEPKALSFQCMTKFTTNKKKNPITFNIFQVFYANILTPSLIKDKQL